jgi:hypothetical protein
MRAATFELPLMQGVMPLILGEMSLIQVVKPPQVSHCCLWKNQDLQAQQEKVRWVA